MFLLFVCGVWPGVCVVHIQRRNQYVNMKYTNPATGILDFCKQMLTAPPVDQIIKSEQDKNLLLYKFLLNFLEGCAMFRCIAQCQSGLCNVQVLRNFLGCCAMFRCITQCQSELIVQCPGVLARF